jgi:hypothetical protein
MTDNINPNHYKVGGIETWDYLKAKLSPTQLAGFALGNVIKYISRADHKNKLEDLKKSKWYLDKIIEEIEKGEPTKSLVGQTFIKHDGKGYPFGSDKKPIVNVLYENGTTEENIKANTLKWDVKNINVRKGFDIIGYQIVKENNE